MLARMNAQLHRFPVETTLRLSYNCLFHESAARTRKCGNLPAMTCMQQRGTVELLVHPGHDVNGGPQPLGIRHVVDRIVME